MTRREQIMQAVVAALAGTAGVGLEIYRSRQEAVEREIVPALIVRAETEDAIEDVSGLMEKKLNVVVEVYHRGAAPDSLADPVVESVHSKIMADATLGGLAIDISEDGTTWDMDDADQTAVIVMMKFSVWYRHQRNNLAG